MTLIKSDLHIHTSEEHKDKYVKHSIKDAIDLASKLNYRVLALTLHDEVYPIDKIKKYASKKGILLIQGVEATIEGKHTLIYCITPQEFKKIKTFDNLRELKKKNKKIFVIAPHPFYINIVLKISLGKKYFENKDVFDALEIHPNYTWFFNSNKKTKRVAAADKKPLVANTDLHFLSHFGKNYSLVDVKGNLTEQKFFDAIRNNKVTAISVPRSAIRFIKILLDYILQKEL
jgi:predicted metal-dependent phosphoesterase TrpH